MSPTKKRTSDVIENDSLLHDEIDLPEPTFFNCPDCVSSAAILYAVTFFLSMVVMELILEGTQNAFADFLGLPYAVTLFQFIVCWALPVATTRGKALREFPKSTRELGPYVFLSLVAFGSTCFKSLSVRWVSFPTKVIFKSTKLIPTMLISTLLKNGQQYGRRDYLAALLLCAGAAGYSYSEHANNDDKQDSYLGLLVLAISVLCDAFAPNIQQRFMAPQPPSCPPPAPSAVSTGKGDHIENGNILTNVCAIILPRGGLGLSASVLMCNTNAVGCLGVLLFMYVSGHIHDAIGVALVRPHLFGNLVLIGFFLAIAVLAHIRLIRESVRGIVVDAYL